MTWDNALYLSGEENISSLAHKTGSFEPVGALKILTTTPIFFLYGNPPRETGETLLLTLYAFKCNTICAILFEFYTWYIDLGHPKSGAPVARLG